MDDAANLIEHITKKVKGANQLQGTSRLEVACKIGPGLRPSMTLLIRTRPELSRSMQALPSRHYPLEFIQNLQHTYALVAEWDARGSIYFEDSAPLEMAILLNTQPELEAAACIEPGIIHVPEYTGHVTGGSLEHRLRIAHNARGSNLPRSTEGMACIPVLNIIHVPDVPLESISEEEMADLSRITHPWNRCDYDELASGRARLVKNLREALISPKILVSY